MLKLLSVLFLLLLAGCAGLQRPPIEYTPGAVLETLSSEVSISVHATDRSMGGHGYLVYRRPDQLHLVLLSPFGNTLFEIFALGERVTLLYPAQSMAYSGRFDELPEKGGLQGWRFMRWMLDLDPPVENRFSGTVQRMGRLGFKETVSFENGLAVSKTAQSGEQVYYSGYKVFNGVPVATEVELRNERDDRIRIVFDEPEVNTHIDASAFTPGIAGMKILPLSELQGL